MEILKNFGVQPVLLAAQIVNFLLILFILRKFFFGPISKVLEDRRQKIEESLNNAELIEKKLQETEEKTSQMLQNASEEAKKVIDSAKEESQRLNTQAQIESRKTLEDAIINSQEQIKIQKAEMKLEIEGETVTLVALVVKKLLGRSLKPEEKKLLTSKSLTEIVDTIHE